jgi:hypothetical protein
MQRLFLQSGLMRDKWEKRRGAAKYGERTVFKACELARDVFIPAERSA